MKRIMTMLIVVLIGFSAEAQFATFEPIVTPLPGQSNITGTIQTTRMTGFVLDQDGYIDKKFQLKASISIRGNKEYYKVISYHEINGPFSYWTDTSTPAQEITSNVAFNRMEEIAYRNFTYYVYLNGNKVWFNP